MSDFVTTHEVVVGDTGKTIVAQLRDANGPISATAFSSVIMRYKHPAGTQERTMTVKTSEEDGTAVPVSEGKWEWNWTADDFTKISATQNYDVQFKAIKQDGKPVTFPSKGYNTIAATLPL